MGQLFLSVLDGGGVYGHVLHYSLVFAMIGSAFLVFIYLWRRKRLDMDEGPKHQMMHEETAVDGQEEGRSNG